MHSASNIPRNSAHCSLFFFFNETSTTKIYTLSLHDALPIFACLRSIPPVKNKVDRSRTRYGLKLALLTPTGMAYHLPARERSEEHTSELQSRGHLVCRLLLEKKN